MVLLISVMLANSFLKFMRFFLSSDFYNLLINGRGDRYCLEKFRSTIAFDKRVRSGIDLALKFPTLQL